MKQRLFSAKWYSSLCLPTYTYKHQGICLTPQREKSYYFKCLQFQRDNSLEWSQRYASVLSALGPCPWPNRTASSAWIALDANDGISWGTKYASSVHRVSLSFFWAEHSVASNLASQPCNFFSFSGHSEGKQGRGCRSPCSGAQPASTTPLMIQALPTS